MGKKSGFGTDQMLHAGENWEGSLGGQFPPGDATTYKSMWNLAWKIRDHSSSKKVTTY